MGPNLSANARNLGVIFEKNAVARLLTGTQETDHITPVQASLHWVPVRYRSEFKVLLFVFKPYMAGKPSASLSSSASFPMQDLSDPLTSCSWLSAIERLKRKGSGTL